MATEEGIRLYPLTAHDLVQAVTNAGFCDYKWQDFCRDLECEGVWVRHDGKFVACYAYTYFNENEGMNERGRLYVTATDDGKLYADW